MKTMGIPLVGMLFASTTYGQSINGCYNKRTGDFRISSKCKKTENPITLAGSQGIQASTGYTGPSVIDGNGQDIGIFVSLAGFNQFVIFNPTLGSFLKLAITEDYKQFSVLGPDEIFMESTDCSGTRYFDKEQIADPLFFQSAYLGQDGAYYVGSGGIQTVKIASKIALYTNQATQSTNVSCQRPCGYYPEYCDPNGVYVVPCRYGDYTIRWQPAIEGSCNQNVAGAGWTTLDLDVIPAQQVKAPFTEPISLPLSFR
jgi:hypothetical protein